MMEKIIRPFGGAMQFAGAVYLLLVLLTAYVISFMDRTALAMLVGPIQKDLALGDTQIGILIGVAFVVLYSTVGLVAGRLADKWDRRLLIIGGMAVWIAATVACGFAAGFTGLLIARILVGVGEATLSPASYSLIASRFPREMLSIAASVYSLGLTIGVGIGTAAIGFIAKLASEGLELGIVEPGADGWRTTFVLIGLIGLPALFMVFTIKEPRKAGEESGSAPSLADTVRHMLESRKTYVPIIGGYAIMAIVAGGAIYWAPTWLIRNHGFTPATAGPLLGLILAVGGTAAILIGGAASDWLYRRGVVDAAPKVVLFSLLLEAPAFTIAYLTPSTSLAVAMFAIGIFGMTLQGGLQGATMQLMAPARMRGSVVAVYLLIANVVGMGFGPFAYAAVTEYVFKRPEAIGQSLAWITLASAVSAFVIIASALSAYRNHLNKFGEEEKPVAPVPTPATASVKPA